MMKRIQKVLPLIIAVISISQLSFAQEKESAIKAKLLIEAGLEYGGDELLKIFFTNGEDQVMRAGQGGYLSVGGQFDFPKIKQFMLRGGVGWKYNTTAADNANIRFTRVPIYLIPFFNFNENFRLGAGITSHQLVRFKGDGFVADDKMKSNLGGKVEFGYKWIALTYSALQYSTSSGEELSGSSVGLVVSFTVPAK
ncbi:hypothetical protein SAMN04488519_11145 [Algoriphagus ornithinivorans]|uniref:Outer membrane protein beta-barrel domain-containing protein n=1 Tax=Algoriphagus ornithinivorans TaxID=226506 RepID=A0A1I5J371_9BACT|nr:hypothetical protein [Algoriphagus ornithinivorans]SFO67324.1 hypothetical protein SAMN04488519_11145 [Algoriphagus ornithinivorans]